YIAEHVGFGNNPRYFSQVFKKYTSVSPQAWMHSLKNNNN
ncbi:MAG: AraC family transcriptional regulator, partial [Lachnospiraceae bacterium]|nr:AraC family transcriptional regulator [Lachnospiraceae bacterium]